MTTMIFRRFYVAIIFLYTYCFLPAGCVSRKSEILIEHKFVSQESPLKSGDVLSVYIRLSLNLKDSNTIVCPEIVLTNYLGKTTATIAKELDEYLEKICPGAEVRVVR